MTERAQHQIETAHVRRSPRYAIFFVLGLLQWIWYRSDKRREQFVKLCRDPDVQKLTWESYMNKQLVRGRFMSHIRVFFTDLGHLLGLARS